MLLPSAGSVAEADVRLSARIDEQLLTAVLDVVPGNWLAGDDAFGDAATARRAYVHYLLTRLQEPRPFVAPTEEVRSRA